MELPEVGQQRCTVHIQRSVLTEAPSAIRSPLGRAIKHVFEAPSKAEARTRTEALTAGLGRASHSKGTAIWTNRRYLEMELLLSKDPVGRAAACGPERRCPRTPGWHL